MDEALNWLEGLPRFSILKYNLYRTRLLLGSLIPEYTGMDVFFITGSKGKGTVAAALAAILRAAGISTGMVTSPHLMRIGERINLDGDDISDLDLARYLGDIKSRLPLLPVRYGTWIFPEVILAAALLWFRDHNAKTVVLEAGLGGRLDPGNLFRRPLAACISSVAMEHKGILGDTLAEIAAEKAGVIKPCTPLITGTAGTALDVIRARAKKFSAPVLVFAEDFGWLNKDAELILPGRRIKFQTEHDTGATLANKAMAACMAALHPRVSDQAIVRGLMAPGLPGRFEVHLGHPVLVLDVAHTPESVSNLVFSVKAKFPDRKIAFAAGFLADKASGEMVQIMAQASAMVFYAPVQALGSYDPGAIDIPGTVRAESITAAIRSASAQADVICVTGSFSAVREARLYCQSQSDLLE